MKKKFILSFILCSILLVSLSSAGAFAGIKDKLEGHWSKNLLEEATILNYFPKYAENNFEKLAPARFISMSDTVSALNLLYKKYDKELLTEAKPGADNFTRKEILSLLAPVLKESTGKLPKAVQAPAYLDISSLNSTETELLALLTERKLMKGSSAGQFSPQRKMTQSEVMILLQRLDHFLASERSEQTPVPTKGIPFRIKESNEIYNDREGFGHSEADGMITLTITKRFSTPGYTLSVSSLLPTDKGIAVELNITSPAPDAILPQVITYRKATIEINKSDIPTNIPLLFLIDGISQETM